MPRSSASSAMEVDLDLARADETGEETFASTHDDPVHLRRSPAPRPSSTSSRRELHVADAQRGAARPVRPGRRTDRAPRTSRPTTSSRRRRRWPTAATARACTAQSTRLTASTTSTATSSSTRRPRVFACFDQPDLKAPYAVSVTAPEGWTVLGNGAAAEVAPGRWELAPDPAAGDLLRHRLRRALGLRARRARRHTARDPRPAPRCASRSSGRREQMLEVTRACFDYYHRLFGIRYPFGEYHQVFVPEFNAGAMENPGCVTFRDTMVFRGRRGARRGAHPHQHHRPRDGAHVVRRPRDHALVGRPVAQRVVRRVHGPPDLGRRHRVHRRAGSTSTVARKMWGYAAERTPVDPPGRRGRRRSTRRRRCRTSTASPTPRARPRCASSSPTSATTRSSPASAAYLREHAYGNGTLADFLGSMERASGQDLGGVEQGLAAHGRCST